MPINVENMTSDVEVVQGDLPMTPQQIERLVQIVLKRLAEHEREARYQRDATEIRNSAVRPLGAGGGDR